MILVDSMRSAAAKDWNCPKCATHGSVCGTTREHRTALWSLGFVCVACRKHWKISVTGQDAKTLLSTFF